MDNEKEIKKIIEIVDKNKSFFITSHVYPDGDSVGSQLALASFLERMGKDVFVAGSEKVPLIYRFLPGSSRINITSKVDKDFDVALVLDCSDLERTGGIIDFEKEIHRLGPCQGDENGLIQAHAAYEPQQGCPRRQPRSSLASG